MEAKIDTYRPPVKISLQKSRNSYDWQIHVSGSTVDEVLPILRDADTKLRNEYGTTNVVA